MACKISVKLISLSSPQLSKHFSTEFAKKIQKKCQNFSFLHFLSKDHD